MIVILENEKIKERYLQFLKNLFGIFRFVYYFKISRRDVKGIWKIIVNLKL